MDSDERVDFDLLEFAADLGRRAGDLTLRWFRRPDLAVDRKPDGTPVTVADRSAEQLVRDAIADRFPDDAIAGEEQGDRPGSSGRRWIVDPIDGTKAFVRGVPLYATLIALHDEKGPAVGVIRLPALGQTVAAARGQGCFLDGTPARVSGTESLAGAYVSTSDFGEWTDEMIAALRHQGTVLRTWGDGYGYALVATGKIDAMVDCGIQPYDVAAMPVILAEAGGRFSDLDGAGRIDSGSSVATNGRIHDGILGALGTDPRPLPV